MSDPRHEIVLYSPAKINWLLRVLGKRGDGFHEIETIFQTISLRDRMTLTPAERSSFTCDDSLIPSGPRNLVNRALEVLDRVADGIPRFAIHVEKSIPAGGGLGGGSSNAATILRALRDRFASHIDDEQLREMALELGSDVPFFLEGGTAYATGRGEELTALPGLEGIRLLLVLPEERVSTAEAYRLLGRGPFEPATRLGVERARELVEEGPLDGADRLTNDFEEVIFPRLRVLKSMRERLVSEGAAWARMSGSGSTIVGAFRDEESRQRAARAFRDARVVTAETCL